MSEREDQRTTPGRRASDTHWINVRENWYRDVWLLAITAVAVIGVLIANGSSGRAQSAASDAQRAAFSAGAAIAAVQQQRIDAIRNTCDAQNRRHDATIATLHRLIARLHGAPLQQAQANVESTIEFIDSLAPHQNCDQIVAAATGGAQTRHSP